MNYLTDYQKLLGIMPDGVIGPKTIDAISKDLNIDKNTLAYMLGQMAVESLGFTRFRENLNYSEKGLLKIFGSRYTPDLAKLHAHHPEMIANHVYSGRMGNNKIGDGWTYRGIFGLQLTGKENIIAFLRHASIIINTDLDSLKNDSRLYFKAADFWFRLNRLDHLCNGKGFSRDLCLKVSKAVNLGNKDSIRLPHKATDREAETLKIFMECRPELTFNNKIN